MDLSTLTAPATPPYDHLHCERTAATSGPSRSPSTSTIASPDHQASISSSAASRSPASPATSSQQIDSASNNDDQAQKGQFHQHPATMPSPPELLHDSEEDEEDSLGSTTPALHLDNHPPHQPTKHSRKSVPHRSPPAVKDAIQASALDKSVVFQLDVRSHPFFPASTSHNQTCPECKLTNCCGMACTTRIICGESLLTALRKRVAQARSEHSNHHHVRRRMAMQRPSFKRTRRTTHIEIPRAESTDLAAVSAASTSFAPCPSSPTPHHSSTLSPAATPSSPTHAPTPPAQPQDVANNNNNNNNNSAAHHHRQASASFSSTSAVSSGRPSRVKGPCQACRESSDGCMRKAFNWPFPTSSSYNDKGKPFVYLCNKCGLRYMIHGSISIDHTTLNSSILIDTTRAEVAFAVTAAGCFAKKRNARLSSILNI